MVLFPREIKAAKNSALEEVRLKQNCNTAGLQPAVKQYETTDSVKLVLANDSENSANV